MRAVRARLMGWGACAALVSGMLVAAPPAANAAGSTVNYTCERPAVTDPVLGIPLLPAVGGTVAVQVDGVAEEVTMPTGGTLGQLTGTLGLSDLLTTLGGTLGQLLGTVEGLAFSLDGVTKDASVSPAGVVTIPAFDLPTGEGDFDLTAPDQFVLKSLDGVLGTVTCTLDPLDPVVTRLLVRAPGPETDGPVVTPGPETPGTETPGTGTPGTGTPGTGEDATTAMDPCVAVPAPRAGQRPTTLKAKAEARSWKKKPAVALTVKARKKPARGTVVACYGTLRIGQATLKKGKATLRTVRFYPGRYRFKLVYLGSATAKPKAKTVLVKVKRR